MKYWLIVFINGNQTIINGEDFDDIHGNFDSDEIIAVIKLNDDIVEKIKAESHGNFDSDQIVAEIKLNKDIIEKIKTEII